MFRVHLVFQPAIYAARGSVFPGIRTSRGPLGHLHLRRATVCSGFLLVRLDVVPKHIPMGPHDIGPYLGFLFHMGLSRTHELYHLHLSLRRRLRTRHKHSHAFRVRRGVPAIR